MAFLLPASRRTTRIPALVGAIVAALVTGLGATAHGHGLGISPVFFFSSPQGPGNAPESGKYELTWIDDEADIETSFELYARTEPIPPLEAFDALDPAGATQLTAAPILMMDQANRLEWDTSALPPGCYQPFTLMSDADGKWNAFAYGKLVVSSGANTGASVWITNDLTDELRADRTFTIKYRVHEPEDASRVTLKYGFTRRPRELTTIVEDLPVPAGGGDGEYTFDFAPLSAGQYSIYAEVTSDDGSTCAAFWPRVVKVPSEIPEDTDGGVTESPDGSFGGPQLPKDETPPEVGCACSAGSASAGLFPILGLMLVALRRRTSAG